MAKMKGHSFQLIVTCDMCKDGHILVVNDIDFKNWKGGMTIQRAFPYLTRAERELLISKTCNTCFNKLFGKEE